MVKTVFRRLARHAACIGACGLGCVLLCTVTAFAADEDPDLPPDPAALRAKAETGNIKAQTQFADLCVASDDYTNAVAWYRKAAEQGDLTAQLSLASLLLAGRGADKNPQEAAKWLRAAADRIETNRPSFGPGAAVAATTNPSAKPPTNAIIITRATPTTNSTKVLNAPIVASSPPPASLSTNPPTLTRVQRAGVVNPADPALVEVQPAVRPPQEPR